MKKFIIATFTILYCCTSSVVCAIGQSSVITLTFPFGARQNGMGEVGTALADDESTVYWNPAGLGPVNERWHGGAVTHFYEPLLPAFDIPDLWHAAFAACYQPRPSEIAPHFDIGGFGFFYNHLNFGENEQYDMMGRVVNRFRSYEYVLGLSWGFNFADMGAENFSAGLGVKFAHSALAPGIGEGSEGTASTVAIDVGILQCFPFGLRIGFTLQNMGPPVFYINKDNTDPIPFTVRLALGYKKEFVENKIRIIRFCAEYNLDKEMVNNEPYQDPDPFWKAIITSWQGQTTRENLEEILHNFGFETTVYNVGSFRMGVLLDKAGSRTELHYGQGVSLLNHFSFDWYAIYSPRRSIARDRQWGVSFTFHNMFYWSNKDTRWWEAE